MKPGPGCHFRDYGPVQNNLLKPDRVLAGVLTVASVLTVHKLLVVWAPKVPPGHGPTPGRRISGFVHSQPIRTSQGPILQLGALQGGVMEKHPHWCGARYHNYQCCRQVVDRCPNH